MDSHDLDRALVASAFELIAADGWERLSVAEAARAAGLPLGEVRARFPARLSVLMRFGAMADAAALAGTTLDGPPRDRLFDTVMRRIDMLQVHRAGVLALFRDLPRDPLTALALGAATLRSMAWLLDGAGLPSHGLRGGLRTQGLLAVWLSTVRAWQSDESDDLSQTMAALDRALQRAAQAENTLSGTSAPTK
jgi:ubiquinone biosynthesis protein COQ9